MAAIAALALLTRRGARPAAAAMAMTNSVHTFSKTPVAHRLAAPLAAGFSNSSGGNQRNNTFLAVTAATAAAVAVAGTAVCADSNTKAAGDEEPQTTADEELAADCGAATRKRAKTFREKKIAEYEDRVRFYSSPDKVFRYFATVSVDGTPYMRSCDFIRSLTPGELQPKEYGLDRFEAISPSKAKFTSGNKRLLLFDGEGNVTNNDDLISYSEYIFLLTVLSTPKHQFALAFCMFDLDGNGIVDIDEFSRVQQAVKSKSARSLQTAVPARREELERSLILNLFFGAQGTGKLDLKRFNDFVDDLRHDVMKLDFLIHNRKMADRSRISPDGLARMLLKYAKIRREERGKFYDRVNKAFGKDAGSIGVDDTLKFFDFLSCIDDIEKALSLYAAAGISITEKDFTRAAKIAAKLDLSPALVHFIFVLFDSDGDGELNYNEFIALMKDARTRGLNRERDLGAERGVKALVQCVKIQMSDASSNA